MQVYGKEEIAEVANLINDFMSEDVDKRINSAHNLRRIADTLGTDRVKKELIPFLKEQVNYDDNKVIIAMLEALPAVGESLGGGVAFTWLFPIVQDLLEHEEEQPRKKAIQIYQQLINLIGVQKCQAIIVGSLKKIHALQFDEAKEAFCCVVSSILSRLSVPNQLDMLNLYQSMAEGRSAVQRKFATMYSKYLVQCIECNETAIMRIVELLFKDKDENNKIYLVDTVIELSRSKPVPALQPYFNLISYQFAWRIRYELIAKIERLAEAIGKDSFKFFMAYYVKYINDIDPEIRSIAILKLQDLVRYLEPEEIVNRILPALKNAVQDNESYVRHSMASSLLYLCQPLSKKIISQMILPKFLQLLKDDEEQVRMTVFKKVCLISDILGIDTLSQSILPVLNQLLTNHNWRTRIEALHIFLYFVQHSPAEFMNQKHVKIITDFLKDKSAASRKEGIIVLSRVLEHLGQPWFEKVIVPKLLLMLKAPNYLHRQILLFAIEGLSPKLSVDCVKTIYPAVMSLTQDVVPNVKLTACTVLAFLVTYLPKQKQTVRKLLKSLSKEDKDKHVRQSAQRALKTLE